MRLALAAVVFLLVGCGAQATQRAERTLPPPLVADELPAEVERPTGGVDTRPVQQCTDEDGEETPPGVLLSADTAAYVGRLRIGYDELRQLYAVDLRTWGREREVYQRHLSLADDEIDRANERAERSWWEQHGDEVGLVGGFILGVVITVGVVAAVDATTTGVGASLGMAVEELMEID